MKLLTKLKTTWNTILQPECPRWAAGYPCKAQGGTYCRDCGRGIRKAPSGKEEAG